MNQELINNIIKYLLSISAISAVLVFIAKGIFNAIVNSGIEKYKTQLNKEVEKFKSELKIKETESNIRFSKLHEERVIVIKELYQKSLKLQKSIFDLTQPFQGIDWHKNTENDNKVIQNLRDFHSYFNVNKILISGELSDKINKFTDVCGEISDKITEAKNLRDTEIKDYKNESTRIWREQYRIYDHEVNIINIDLIEEFRRLFGVM